MLKKNYTWDLVDISLGKKLVGCKWVYTIKFRAGGIVERHKYRLVAMGFTQTNDIDYKETFAPVVKLSSVRVPLLLAVYFSWKLHQFCVKTCVS